MENKQTAVEWFAETVRTNRKFSWDVIVEQAKQIEKEQIMDAWKDSNLHRWVDEVLEYSAEEYYNETYGE